MAYYARRYRYRSYSSGRMSGKELAAMVAIGVLLAGASGRAATHGAGRPVVADAVVAPAAGRAVAYARAQLGKPYEWGGTGPAAFDCSGLVMMAWRAAGVDIARTSQTQWATLRHIPGGELQPGDLIFYAGADGTVASPGHVVMYVGGGTVIQAYATGYPVMLTPLADMDAGGLTGYARP